MFPVFRVMLITITFVAVGLDFFLATFQVVRESTLRSVSETIQQNRVVIEDFRAYGSLGQEMHQSLAFVTFVEPVVQALDSAYGTLGKEQVTKQLAMIDGRLVIGIEVLDGSCRSLLWLRDQFGALAQLDSLASASNAYWEMPDGRDLPSFDRAV